LQGNSGPYMQYTYARCVSVLNKAKAQGILSEPFPWQDSMEGYQLNEEEKAVLRLLYRFNEVVQMAASEYAPHHLATYLFELAQSFNAFYNKHNILGKAADKDGEKSSEKDQNESGKKQTELRLLITQSTADVVQKGLQLLGIKTLEKM